MPGTGPLIREPASPSGIGFDNQREATHETDSPRVEDDALQRDYIVTLLEESDMDAIGCKSAEAACACIDMCGNRLITDNRLAGRMTGCELAQHAKKKLPHLKVVVVSGMDVDDLPPHAAFLHKPLIPLNVLRCAELAR